MEPWRVMAIVVLLLATYTGGVSAEFLLTPSFTKALITGYPRGLVTSVEIDIYHPLPDTLDGWRPKIFDKPSTSAPPLVMSKEKVVMHPVPNYIGGEEEWPAPAEWEQGEKLDYSWYPPPPPHKKWYSDFLPKPVPVMLPAWSNKRQIYVPRNDDTATEGWMHFRPHRERREIYSNLEDAASLLGFNIRSCILRTICEARHSLLPPGKSFIQDVIRILFVIPSKEEWMDEYSLTARSDERNCSFHFGNDCPVSIVEFLLHGDRVI